jgi:zinc protease
MTNHRSPLSALLLCVACAHPSAPPPVAAATAPAVPPLDAAEAKAVAPGSSAASFALPVESYALPNGLKVVLSRDSTAPVVAIGVYYHIGFRIEPRDRTGFAHPAL